MTPQQPNAKLPTTNKDSLDEGVQLLKKLSRDQLIEIIVDDAKNWLWSTFTAIEAKRIMARLGLKPGGGIPALVECLKHRFYARINLQQALEITDTRAVFQMVDCRVQSARKRKGLPDFPCKSVGIVEYTNFAKAIDPRIETKCIACPPDAHPDSYFCAWEFTLTQD